MFNRNLSNGTPAKTLRESGIGPVILLKNICKSARFVNELHSSGSSHVIFVNDICILSRFVKLDQSAGNDPTISLSLSEFHHRAIFWSELRLDHDAGIVHEKLFILRSISIIFVAASSDGNGPVRLFSSRFNISKEARLLIAAGSGHAIPSD